MHVTRWSRRFWASAVLALSAGCARDVTAPAGTARQLAADAKAHLLRRDTYVNGSTITATGDDGTTVTLDQSVSPAVLTANGQSITLPAVVADSLRDALLRMATAEQQALYVQSSGVSGGGVPPSDGVWNPIEYSDPRCPAYVVICDGNGGASTPASGAAQRGAAGPRTGRARTPTALAALGTLRAGRPYALGPARSGAPARAATARTMTASATTASAAGSGSMSRDVAFDADFTCTDISRAIYNEMPTFRTAKTALLAGLLAAVTNMAASIQGIPPEVPDPKSWLNWFRFYSTGPALDLLYANYEDSRLKLGTYAVMFNAQDCIHDTTPPAPDGPTGGGGDVGPGSPVGSGFVGGGGGVTCYEIEYYYTDTGEVYAVEDLGCG